MVLLPEEQAIDQFAQFGKLSAFPLHPVRSAADRLVRPAAEYRVDELVKSYRDLFSPFRHSKSLLKLLQQMQQVS